MRVETLYCFKMNTVKKTFLFLLAIVCLCSAQAQGRKIIYLQNYDKAPYHFGFLLGANFMDYNMIVKENYQNIHHSDFQDLHNLNVSEEGFKDYQITLIERDTTNRLMKSIPRIGFSVGVLGDLRLGEYLNLRFAPTFSLSEINYSYVIQVNQTDGTSKNIYATSHNPYLSCLEFPLHLKYRSKRYNNVAAYLIAGCSPKLFFSFKKRSQSIDWLENKAGDLALEMGGGFDIYNQWFKMGIEAKFSFGMLNALNDSQVDFYAHPLKSMKNKQFQLSMTFE